MRNTPSATGSWLVPAACAIALLYFGRAVLEPVALAAVLRLAFTPLVRRLERAGLRHTAAALVAVVSVGVCVAGITLVLAFQLAAVARDLPQYRTAITAKFDKVRDNALGPLEKWITDVGTIVPPLSDVARQPPEEDFKAKPVPVEIQPSRAKPGDALSRVFTSLWGPLGEGFIVLVLLVFMLFENDSLRERWLQLAGEGQVARTMLALTDTDEGVSRYLLSLVSVNAAFGVIIAGVLWLVGVPHAALWGVISCLLRFVPYIGIPVAALFVCVFAAASDPGWSLVMWSMGAFVALELVVANFVEPAIYGRGSGLAPLAVIFAALFWGTLWGPVGLVLSTPLTLCLVVAGRHTRALSPIAILLGETNRASDAQRLYQRALAGEAQQALDEARMLLRHQTLARYCDSVLLPAIALAVRDAKAEHIEVRQMIFIRETIASLAEALAAGKEASPAPRKAIPINANLGERLREARRARLGPWQGSFEVPPGSIVLCAALAVERDQIVSELLVSALREGRVDARSVVWPPPENPGADKASLVSMVFIGYPVDDELAAWRAACKAIRERLPHALLALVRTPIDAGSGVPKEDDVKADVDVIVHSFADAAALVSHPGEKAKPQAPRQVAQAG
jgi:predicted PurR-regulated permease PerM